MVSKDRNIELQHHIPIIIVNWNGYTDTVECIDSVFNLSYPDFKIYLVDNGSEAGEGRKLADRYSGESKIEVILSDENMGFTLANNFVVDRLIDTNITYIALLNNDTVVDEDWLSNLVRSAESNAAQVISSKILDYNDHSILDNAGHRMLNTGEVIPIGHGEPSSHYQENFKNLGSCAAGALYHMDMVRQIGFFDTYFSTGYEDAEFGMRAFLTGNACIFEPSAVVYHKFGSSIKKVFNANYVSMIQRSIWYSYFKLMPWPVVMVSLPFILVKVFLFTVFNLIFWRPRHLKMYWRSLRDVLWTDRVKLANSRRAFHQSFPIISSWKVLTSQTFFLFFDLKRFVDFYLKGKPSAWDQYGS
ncbi:MAG: glycosyltransferase family 2 protein [Saprospiraceae bacterium]|nr:glycosyltransferase family 2 protein [Saprospiraceae bacterium]